MDALRGFKGQIYDPRAILRKQEENQAQSQQQDLKLRVEVPQRLLALEGQVAALERRMDDTLEDFRAAIEMLQTGVQPEMKRRPGRPRKVTLEPDAQEG